MYKFYDKYVGQKHLTEETFFNYLKLFFFDGKEYHLDVIEELIVKLQKLRETINQLDTYRFFSTSLLLVYEGKRKAGRGTDISNGSIPTETSNSNPCETSPPLVEARLIDFENLTQELYTKDPIKYSGPDAGAIKGLTTIIVFLQSILLTQTSTSTQQNETH